MILNPILEVLHEHAVDLSLNFVGAYASTGRVAVHGVPADLHFLSVLLRVRSERVQVTTEAEALEIRPA